ncbi:Trehalase [Hartmannibacter diazotrophicus]|uniref:Trehalase n=1 Tax=Hartmannibacter diazotrophicus TaxID=1482074 RepID=A0A2C9D4D4_9HYPH|nr:glycoside hydrolase family 15 protein [Hartmannibacter diazotrophicus]SON55144.1 Trehalase [Hartmannibacter diazotrophicus]
MTLRIDDYALIGDCRSAALVGRNGSIDWLCWPNFDSEACFAALLGDEDNGHWQIGPRGDGARTTRRYRPDTLILETEFETETGRCRVTDFMPEDGGIANLVRIVTGLEGHVDLRMDLVIRFDYGRLVPWVSLGEDGLIAIAGPDLLVLRTPVEHHGEDFSTVAEFTVTEGDEIPFVLSHGASHLAPPPVLDWKQALDETDRRWRDWAGQCNYEGPWRDIVVRSLITLKALTFSPTGGMVAAPTTSLPEEFGGERNWDYRFCWLRDATFVLLALMQAGYQDEASAWRGWLVRAVAGLPSQLQPIYSITGDHRLDERIIPWLGGFAGSKPVRIGNDAYAQTQLDVFGEVLDALHHARRKDLTPDETSWALQKKLLRHLETLFDSKDRGIWESRGPEQHFTYSNVMIWVAFDRAVAAVEEYGLEGPVEHWRRLRDEKHREICEKAFDAEQNTFVQAYGSPRLDAALLLLPLVGFVDAKDPRMVGTVKAIESRLMWNGYIRRYDNDDGADGLSGKEGVFLACTFWYIDNLILQERRADAKECFERLLALCNDVGLLSEEFDVEANEMLGNFPQALSHLALIGTAFNFMTFDGPARERPKLAADE